MCSRKVLNIYIWDIILPQAKKIRISTEGGSKFCVLPCTFLSSASFFTEIRSLVEFWERLKWSHFVR